jgi:hypothetical protein
MIAMISFAFNGHLARCALQVPDAGGGGRRRSLKTALFETLDW